MQRLNTELHALTPTLVRLRSKRVYHTGGSPVGTRSLPTGGTVRAIRGGDVVTGLFREPRRMVIRFGWPPPPELEYMLRVNRDPRRPARLRAELRPEITGIAEMSRRSGREGRRQLPDGIAANAFENRMAPGDGRLFALVERRREGWPAPGRGFGVRVDGIRVGIGR